MKETEVAPEWDSIHGLRGTDFGDLTETALTLATTIRELQEQLDATKAQIQDHLTRSHQESVRYGQSRITLVKGREGTRKLDPELLQKNGVKMSIIERSYSQGPPGKPYVKLTTRED